MRRGQPVTDSGAHPLEVSGVGALATCGGVCPPRCFVSVCPGSWPLIGVRAHRVFQVWVPFIWVRTSQASGESWGCLS